MPNKSIIYIAFIKENINGLEDYEIEELYDYLYNHSEECYSIWSDFKIFLYKYLPNTVNSKKYENFEAIMNFFAMECLSLKLRKFAKYDKQMLITRKESLANIEEMLKNGKMRSILQDLCRTLVRDN
ncbi:MAG: hypothetical protein LBU85_00225 [Treponema sp.]|nr:hypothetical protein [Treponema sp.]